MNQSVAITHSGLVTSVGLSAPAACAAIRAAIANHTETRFKDRNGEWILGAQVNLERPWTGRRRLLKMLAAAVRECVDAVEGIPPRDIPLLLCLAEIDRPGRITGLDEDMILELEREIAYEFHPQHSAVIPQGRVAVAVALANARDLLREETIPHVLIAGVDSLLVGDTLTALQAADRLLTSENSNGFVPGEAASALVVSRARDNRTSVVCEGLGFALEPAFIESGEPLRADGLRQAIRAALTDARCDADRIDFRITDISGEHYYFKEAALGLTRLLRTRKDTLDIWHPADCIGEVGAAIGPAALAVALAACAKAYAPGPMILFSVGSDNGRRAAAVLRCTRLVNGQ